MAAQVAQGAQHDFWRPPTQVGSAESVARSSFVEACDQCGTEFIVGSRFCHNCGANRPESSQTLRFPARIGTLRLSRLAERLGLSTGPFLAFLLGVGCVIGAVSVSFVFSANTVLDWQALQLWRIEWLLGAVAAFVAGSLLKTAR